MAVLETLTKYDAPQVTEKAFSDEDQAFRMSSKLLPYHADYFVIGRVAAGVAAGKIETVTYKNGGASGTTIAVITLTYDDSGDLQTATVSDS